MITITRKIRLFFDTDNKSELKQLYEKIYSWQRICHRAANWIATHHYLQENLKELFYITEEKKVKLANIGGRVAIYLLMIPMSYIPSCWAGIESYNVGQGKDCPLCDEYFKELSKQETEDDEKQWDYFNEIASKARGENFTFYPEKFEELKSKFHIIKK